MTNWPQIFIDLPPGTRVRVMHRCPMGYYEAGMEGVLCTHADDGCSLVAFDAPLKSLATKTKPADAWWVDTEFMERLT